MTIAAVTPQAVPDTVEADVVRQSIVVLMGTLAQHMDKTNPKVGGVTSNHMIQYMHACS